MSVSDWLSWLRCYHMRGTLAVGLKANLYPRHQHCTNEAQKAETVLSAVSYIYIYIWIDIDIMFLFASWIFNFSVLSRLSLLHWLSSSLLLYEWFLYIYIFLIFFQNYIIYTTHNTILNLRYGHIYELYWEWVMQHGSQTILKENKVVVNLILPKTSNNYCTLRNLVKSVHFKGSQFQLQLISILVFLDLLKLLSHSNFRQGNLCEQ